MGIPLTPRSSQRMNDWDPAYGGYVQEANRRFFHILDLELVSIVGNEGLELQLWKGQSFGSGLVFAKQDEDWSPVRQSGQDALKSSGPSRRRAGCGDSGMWSSRSRCCDGRAELNPTPWRSPIIFRNRVLRLHPRMTDRQDRDLSGANPVDDTVGTVDYCPQIASTGAWDDLALLGKIAKEPDPFEEPVQEFMGHFWPIAGDVGEDFPGLRTSVWRPVNPQSPTRARTSARRSSATTSCAIP